MNKAVLSLALSALLLLSARGADIPAWSPQYPARAVQLGQADALRIDRNSQIVIAPDASRVTRFAANELQTLLGEVLSAQLPIVTELPADQTAIVLGFNTWSQAAGLDPEQLVRDGFFLKTQGRNLFIAGKDDPDADIERAINRGGAWSHRFDRGTLFGVYDFLERFAGARFYFPSLGTVLPKAAEIKLPECSIFERPDFCERKISVFWDGIYFEGENRTAVIIPDKNLNSYRLRLGTVSIPCCHGLAQLNYLERFKEKPEYFALLTNGHRHNNPGLPHPGQLCYSSGIREEIYQDAKTLLTRQGLETRPGLEEANLWRFREHHTGFADIMPQDSFTPCQCEQCKKAYTDEVHYASDLMWGLTVEIANRLKAENVPGFVTMMGYTPYRRVPEFPIPDNVMVMVAQSGPWYMRDAARHEQENIEIKAWAEKLNHKVWLWNYANKVSSLSMPGIPAYTPRAIGRYYQKLAPWIFGAFVESESDRFLYMAMNHYLFAKVAWDNSIDPDAAVDEFYRLMFGPAAAEMQVILDRFEDIWISKVAGRVVETALGPMGSPPSDYDLWNKVFSPALMQQITAEFDRAEKLTAPGSLEAQRVQLFRREYLEPLQQASNAYREKTDAVKGLHLHLGEEPAGTVWMRPFKIYNSDAPDKEKVNTRVQAFFGAEALHFIFDCEEPAMDQTVAAVRKFDDPEIWKDNSVELFLNPSNDCKTYYQILVNSQGSVSDQSLVKIGINSQGDWAWNANAETKVTPSETGYRVEIAVPYQSLPGLKREEFRANFARNRILKDLRQIETLYSWSPFIRGFHDLENFGTLGSSRQPLLINGDFSFEPSPRSARHWGLWDDKHKWLEGWIGAEELEQNVRDSEIFFSPPASMRLVSTTGQAAVTYWSVFKLQPGKRYRVSYMVKLENVTPTKSGGGAVLNLCDVANRWFPAHNWLTGTADWTRQSFEFTAADGTNQERPATIRLYLIHANGTAWFDDVELIQLEDLPNQQ